MLAEREGFEPPIPVKVCLISSQVHSTGLCHLSVFVYNNLRADLIVPFRHCNAGYDTADFVPHHVRFPARLDSNPVSQMHSPWFLAFQLSERLYLSGSPVFLPMGDTTSVGLSHEFNDYLLEP